MTRKQNSTVMPLSKYSARYPLSSAADVVGQPHPDSERPIGPGITDPPVAVKRGGAVKRDDRAGHVRPK